MQSRRYESKEGFVHEVEELQTGNHSYEVCTEAVGTAGGKRQKLPSSDAERHKGSGGKELAASSAEVWK